MWEDVELGFRLHKAGMILHFRKNCLAYHNHIVTLKSFIERQRMVGWYSYDLERLKVPIGYHFSELEKKKIYSKKILSKICSLILESSKNTQRTNEDKLKKVYNYVFRYAGLLGYMERKSGLVEGLEGSFGLLYNLTLTELEIIERDKQICKISNDLSNRDEQIAILSNDLSNRDEQIAILSNDLSNREQIAILNQSIKEYDKKVQVLLAQVIEKDLKNQSLLDQLSEERSRLKLMLEEVMKYALSKSWNWTRPLRKITKILKGK
jgi:hypothetical protein